MIGTVLNLTPGNLKQLIRNGDLEKLEQVVLEGQGKKLVGEYSPDYKVRVFLKSVPALISKLSLIHDAVNSGRLEELQALLDEEPNNKKKYALSKDESGVGLLHKAVYYDLKDIAKYLANNFPGTVQLKDSEGRTAYHYTPACKDAMGMQKMLVAAGADPSVVDNKQNTVKYYTNHPQELELPSTHKITSKSTIRRNSRNNCIGYYTSLKLASRGCKVIIACRSDAGKTKEKIVEFTGNPNITTKYLDLGSLDSIRRFADEINQTEERLDILINNAGICHSEQKYTEDGLITVHQVNHYGPFLLTHLLIGLVIKKSNIRIWIHQRDLNHLQQVVWEGHGSKLLVEHSNNGKIRKFLEAVPYIMGLIKDIHCDVQNDDLESLKGRVNPPVPPVVLSGKDCNGLTPLHKAAGLGSQQIAEFIIAKYPKSVNLVDGEGRTPLHYAALLKDDGKMNDFLIESGADESALDNKQKSAGYYRTRNSEIDAKLLQVVPDSPRTARDSFPATWDWNLLTANTPTEELVKVGKKADMFFGTLTESKSQQKLEQLKDSPMKETKRVVEECDSNGNENSEEGEKEETNETEEDKQEETNEEVEENEEIEPSQEDTNEEEHHQNSEDVQEDQNDENENPTKSRPHSQMYNKSRPASQMNETKSRPSSQMYDTAKSRPNSQMYEDPKSRPGSLVQHPKSRPASEMDENQNNRLVKSRPGSEMVENPPKTRPSSRFESHANSDGEGEVEPEEVIEGVVNGENEIETLNEEGQGKQSKNEDPEVKALIEEGNMEQLAALVLEGEGERLIGQQSDNAELQSFLDNVPTYMSKINRIHVAARNGSLRDLQAALDRRKFAIAKDIISPNGATPLHVAVIFGNTSIVRYLAGRFPETLLVVDNNGRTPLHYASVIADNGHYYNLLIHLGANNKTEDNFGNTPEYYRTDQDTFNHRQLLREFGAEEEAADEMLSDKVPDDTVSSRKDLDDEDMLGVLEKCFNILHGRRSSNATSATSTITMSSSSGGYASLIGKHMKRYVFDEIKLRVTKLDHNLYDVIWTSVKKLPTEASFRAALEQDFSAGVVAPDAYSYGVFNEFLIPLIKDVNCIDIHLDLHEHPPSKFVNVEPDSGEETKVDVNLDLDSSAKWIISDNPKGSSSVDIPFFCTEEGRYLASSLGDPLIKGLTEVANKRPEDPIAYLATYLYNFANNNKSQSRGKTQENQQFIKGAAEEPENNTSIPATIDVVTLEPEENNVEDDSAFSSTSRDEHGQSMLHFAAARNHGRNALYQLLLETDINVGYRDELYRTARDISIQANIPENTMEIDRYIIQIATQGDTDKLVELLLDGYDHIIDIADEDNVPIIEAVAKNNQPGTVAFLQSILAFEEKRERVHHAIRQGLINDVMKLLADENETGSGKLLAIGRNSYGRCSLHVAVLCQQEEIVDYLANTFPDTLKLGDNLERTALHYAMGVDKIESISRVLIKAGAKRVLKDLKGRQPTYYFMNKSDILRLQEEEETF